MVSVQSLVEELAHVSDFIFQQAAAGNVHESVRTAQCASMRSKIIALPKLGMSDAAKLTAAVCACGWSDEQKQELATVVAEKASAIDTTSPRARRCNQSSTSFELYLTESEWAQVADPRLPLVAKLSVVARRAVLIGLTCPDEATCARIAGIVQLKGLGELFMSGSSQYNLLTETKT